LQSKALTVKPFDSEFNKGGNNFMRSFQIFVVSTKVGIGNILKGIWGTTPQEDSYRSVAKFLSKQGKSVCSNLLQVLFKEHSILFFMDLLLELKKGKLNLVPVKKLKPISPKDLFFKNEKAKPKPKTKIKK